VSSVWDDGRILYLSQVADLLKCNYIKQLLYRKFSLWGGNLDWEKNPEENLPSRILQLRMLIITMMFSPHNLTSSNTPINVYFKSNPQESPWSWRGQN